LWVCARFRGRAGSGTRPWVVSGDCGERQIRRDKPAADRGTETEGTHALGVMGSEFEKHVISQTPLGRFGQPGCSFPVV
jgi:3-oxoacyl-[acyl-carrier protein] reductase